MARATPSTSSDSARDAVALLKQDHRTVEALFDQFEKAEEEERSSLAERICQLLTVHAQIEEEILYPAAREALEEEGEEVELVAEAQVEHATAKELIGKIEAMSGEEEQFAASVKVLGEYVKHHVKEEEGELFPKLRKTEIDLKEMGSRLAERKFSLMEQMGIPQAEPVEARKQAAGGSRASRAKSARARASKSGRRSANTRAARH
ncbi:MAG TPA: hemerythrin domain-containing protein [Steroidobacteraceae bacterium]|jgi:hemerythrin superfamily protein